MPKKKAKKLKKLKNASMALFKARIEWKMPRRKENKYCRSVSFLPNAIENSKKIAKKFKKI